MSTWIKWWKDKTFMTILIIALSAMIIGFLSAYFIDWGWIITIILSAAAGVIMRKIIIKRIDEEVEKYDNQEKTL